MTSMTLFFIFSIVFFFGLLAFDRIEQQKTFKLLWPVSLLPFILAVALNSWTIVDAGNIGVQTTMGNVNPVSLNAGFHIVNPISDIHQVSVRLDKATLKHSQAGTKDLQIVHTDIVVNYRLEGIDVANIYKNYGFDLADKILLPAINESFKAITAHYNSEELITKRDVVSLAIKNELSNKVAKYGLSISEISLVNFGFSPEYQAAIEQKVIATQSTLKAEQDLQRIKVQAQQNIAQAQGEAEAIRIQSAAIETSGGINYVHLKAIEKWNGQLPASVLSGDNVPFVSVPK